MKVQKNIEVWLVKKRLPRPIDLVQYDTGIQIVFALQDFTIPGGTTATLYVQKPSGKFVYQETGITTSENSITIDLENQAITEHGNDIPYQVRLKNGNDLITTFAGIFRVEKSLADANAVESKTVVAAFEAKTAEQLAKIEAETLDQIALVQAASQTEQEAIENKGLEVLNTIPADYTATAALAEKVNREKGSAIVCEAEGEVITVADASDDYVRGLKIFGKTEQAKTNGYQIFDISRFPDFTAGGTTVVNNADGTKTVSNGGVTMLVNQDGTMKISGSGEVTALYSARFDYTHEETVKLLKAGKLYCNFGAVTVPKLFIQINNESGTLASMNNEYSTIASVDITQEMLNDEGVFLRCSFYQVNGTIVQNTIKPMLYQDGDGTWEAFSGGAPSPSPDYPQELESVGASESIGVTVAGKNLLPCAERTEVKNGVTFAGNADGITANGTATAQCYFLVDTFVPSVSGKYIVSGCPSGGNINQYNVQVERNSASVCNEFGSGAVVDLEAGGSYKFYAVVRIGYTANNLTFKPMIRLASVTDATYEPYKEVQTLAASAEGGLHGIGEVKDEIDFAKGVRIRRLKKIVLNGSEGWKNFGSDGVAFCFNDYDLARASDYRTVSAVMCDCLQSVSHNDCMRGVVKNSICLVADQNAIGVCIDGIESVDALKVYLNEHPMGVVAMLLAPAEIPLTAEELAQFAALHSNKPNTTAFNDSGAHMALEYNADSKTYIDNKFAELAAAIVNKA